MHKARLYILLGAIVLSLSLAGMTLAADTANQGPDGNSTETDAEIIQVTIDATQSDMVVPFEGVVTANRSGPAGSMGPSGFANPDAVLWDNGPLVTHPGGGAGGADASALQTALGMNTYGFGHQVLDGNRIADEFVIDDPLGWQIDQITFFPYQTSSDTSCTIDHVNYQIWDGPPNDPGSTVVFGDTTTNRLVSCSWTNIYRVLDTALTNTDRPIMAAVADAGVALQPGTYWLDWQSDGTLSSGPWASPISILGQTTTGNALQWTPGTSAWLPAVDSGTSTPQGLPFMIDGSVVVPPGITLTADAYGKSGCADGDVSYTITLANNTGSNATFALAYTSYWQVSGPAQLFVAQGDSASFNLTVSVPCGGMSDVTSVTATGNGFSDQVELVTTAADGFTDWESIAPINGEGRSRPAAAAVNGKVYVLGGETPGGNRANTVEEFNPATGSWTTKAGLMPTPASNICAAAIGNDIYIPGGYNAVGAYLATLQVYHTATDSWDTIASDPLPAERAGLACAVVNGKLYAFGGTDGTYQSTTYVYDPAAAAGSRWTTLASMTYPRAYLAGVAVNGKVYAIGGRDSVTTDFTYVEAFNPADGLWHTVTGMNAARGGPGAFVINNWLIACGGGWSTYLDSCEVYDTNNGYAGSWVNMDQSLISGRRTFAYASLPGGLYAVAGWNSAHMTSAERLPYFDCPACTPPVIGVYPHALLAAQPADRVTTQPLHICNDGQSLLNWALNEVPIVESNPISIPASDGNFPRGDEPVSIGLAPRVDPGESGVEGGFTLAGEAAYGMRFSPDVNLVNFPDTSTPGVWNVLAEETGMPYFAGDFINGDFTRLYVLDYGENKLYSLNTTTGQATLIGNSIPIGVEQWTGMTASIDGVMYASSTDIIRSTLYTINLQTGAATVVGQITNAPGIIDIAIRTNGEIYGVDIVTDELVRIDRTTGAGSVVGSIGFDANYAQGMDFEETSGILYLAAYNISGSRGELRVADIVTGNTALVGPFPLGSEVDAFAFATSLVGLIPWVSESPGAGTVGPDQCQVITVTFDSTCLANGAYKGELKITSDDPGGVTTFVDVTLEVGFFRQFLPHTQRH